MNPATEAVEAVEAVETTEAPFVDIRDLTVTFTGGKTPVKAVNGVTWDQIDDQYEDGAFSWCVLFCFCCVTLIGCLFVGGHQR